MSQTEPPHAGEDAAAALAADFADVARALFSAGGEQDTLTAIAALAVATIDGCDFAGIFVVEGATVATPVYTAAIVAEVDALQHRAGEGPCLDAISHRKVFYAADLSDDDRWPMFGPQATGRELRSLLALPLLSNGTQGALNLYARYPNAFGVVDRARGQLLAGLAASALSSAQSHDDAGVRVDHLQAALATREVIAQAQGILMERERITGEAAFDVLRRASQNLNLKLREVAQTVVETGETPGAGPGQPSP